MNYANMTCEELVKEAYFEDNELALELIKHFEEIIEDAKEETSVQCSSESYQEGYDDAVEDMRSKLEMM